MQLYEMIEGISKFIYFITFQLADNFCWATKLVKKKKMFQGYSEQCDK